MNLVLQIDFRAHAYLIRTNDGDFDTLLKNHIEEHVLGGQGSADMFAVRYESLSVDEARTLANYASLKPLGEKKYIIISVKQMTSEAQNALLKIVEDGAGHSVFFFVLAPGVPVLPTLLSRCVVLKSGTDEKSEQENIGKEFLSLSYKERLLVAEKFGKDSDRHGARSLVRSLLSLAGNCGRRTSAISGGGTARVLRDLLDADRYLQLSGSSPKAVIGHLALTL